MHPVLVWIYQFQIYAIAFASRVFPETVHASCIWSALTLFERPEVFVFAATNFIKFSMRSVIQNVNKLFVFVFVFVHTWI